MEIVHITELKKLLLRHINTYQDYINSLSFDEKWI
ncbi:hypothetical protein DFH41_003610 [Clostridium beijerinckii]|nr:hypothetical protein [Clostridium beijerinckii]NRU21164.1 hypothetical protein [Clostridium beijerinckii]NRU89023.1 hypothetical protein [Clostridium beijerinckii]NRV41170.1 hypothetical protein [Clostridium beijerinckii]NRV79241.1 hypothetical protein [Clostridium beijerinckii]